MCGRRFGIFMTSRAVSLREKLDAVVVVVVVVVVVAVVVCRVEKE